MSKPPEATPQSVTFLTPDDLAPILATLEEHAAKLADHETRIAELEAAPPSEIVIPPEPSDVPPPDKTIWETNMVEWGEKHGQYLVNPPEPPTVDQKLNFTYYDMWRCMYQIADYTGNAEPWNTYAKEACKWYRDDYLVPNNAGVPGYWNFTTGLRMDYERTGDEESKRWAILLSTNASFTPDYTDRTYVTHHGTSREIAYAILAYINAEALGEAKRAIRAEWVTLSHDYIRQWQDQANWGTDGICPFMMGLTAHALIEDWKETHDTRLLPALKQLADWVWPIAWHEPRSAMLYQLNPTNTTDGYSDQGAVDLNMIIAPWFAWLYVQTGDDQYREKFDKLLYGHKDAWMDGGKQWDQNFWWSMEGMRWREGEASA